MDCLPAIPFTETRGFTFLLYVPLVSTEQVSGADASRLFWTHQTEFVQEQKSIDANMPEIHLNMYRK